MVLGGRDSLDDVCAEARELDSQQSAHEKGRTVSKKTVDRPGRVGPVNPDILPQL